MDSRIKEIRENEKKSHIEIYSKEDLYHTESWLKKPIKTVEDIVPFLCDLKEVQVLDLGCGVGRNSIYVAKEFQDKECTLSIHMQNDTAKGKGYGTEAEKLAIKYAFEELGMKAVNADTVLKNTRSQHVMEKVGFKFIKEDGDFRYYKIERQR